MWDWADFLPVPDRDCAVTLGEGMTPLVRSRLPLGTTVHWKNEGRNPTGSQKDRALSVAITKARLTGAPAVVIASTGSAGFACAAYSARAGLPCTVLVPSGTPRERLAPMRLHGARVIEIDGTFEDIEGLLAGLDPARWYQASTVAALNPDQAEAPKTIAFEIVHQLGTVPDWVAVPIGGGATLAGIWRGFEELRRLGETGRSPRLIGIQSSRFDAVARAFAAGASRLAELGADELPPDGDTILRNLKHRLPPDGDLALAAIRESGGVAVTVSDEAALAGQRRLATQDGVFGEASSTVLVEAIERLAAAGTVGPDETVVGIVTGSGLREQPALELGAVQPVAVEVARKLLA